MTLVGMLASLLGVAAIGELCRQHARGTAGDGRSDRVHHSPADDALLQRRSDPPGATAGVARAGRFSRRPEHDPSRP